MITGGIIEEQNAIAAVVGNSRSSFSIVLAGMLSVCQQNYVSRWRFWTTSRKTRYDILSFKFIYACEDKFYLLILLIKLFVSNYKNFYTCIYFWKYVYQISCIDYKYIYITFKNYVTIIYIIIKN